MGRQAQQGASWVKCARVAIALAVVCACTAPAVADEIAAKGVAMQGKVTGVGSSGVTFEPALGKGQLAVDWENIEAISTAGPFQVLYGDDQESDAPLEGFRDGHLIAGAASIDVATIHSGLPLGDGGPSFQDRMRSRWRYWDGNFDLAFNLQQATTDTTGFALAFKTTRKKDPTRLIMGAGYRFATEKEKGEDKSTTQDQAAGLLRGEYDFTPRIYGFASGDGTYDAIQHLSIRAVPKTGVGYVIWKEKLDASRDNFLQAEVGGGYVYERYFGGDSNDYFAIAFGALAGYYLPYGAHFDWRVDYLPAVDDFAGDYLLRNEAGLTLPLMAPINAKFGLLDEYDSTPSDDSDKNSLYLTFGLSIAW